MSIARHIFNEFRPLFRMLEEPLTRSPALRYSSVFNDPFFNGPALARPAVDVSEEGNKYIIEAELPGVPKENVDVRVGDHGHSVTIEGKVTSRRGGPAITSTPESGNTSDAEPAITSAAADTTTAVAHEPDSSNHISVERQLVNNSSFTRTVWLPRPVDGSNVSAQLKDGVLTLTLPKSVDEGSVKITVD
ncbi:HSP20-like chaperone [Lentinula lateritia]|uniref:HSP20-like chaperone n=1 Tax=Lentinula aff. lateritia TaxID=2804960 RepID=A0ACC1UEC8_9AGAR|nr:HSP20-like chaperone [Lentinula aff. lateritia]KAJ3849555.1 HSP20-like chaperone [Lentinula lateritia]